MVSLALLAGAGGVNGQEPLIHMRADTLLDVRADGRVTAWKSVTGDARFVPDTAHVRPLFVASAINGRPAIRFANDGYLRGPSVFPTQKNYTLYVVYRWDGQSASNNLVSGTTRALFLANSPYAKVLHSGDFSRLAQSSIAANGPTVVRVEFMHNTGRLILSNNNVVGDDVVIPANTDPAILIGSYAQANFFWGDIAEVVIYDRTLDSLEKYEFEQDLHARYGIQRQPDPARPVVLWNTVPSTYHFVHVGDELVLDGTVNDPSVVTVEVSLDSSNTEIQRWKIETETSKSVSVRRLLHGGLHFYTVRVDAKLSDGRVLRIVTADSMVCGIALAIQGQSNSIFADPTLESSPYARTFGTNFSQSARDTLYARSRARESGGGPNVGGWGLRLQNHIADELGLPSCIINGGVGGTRIEQHFPSTDNRINLGTIYGSWLYRMRKSNLASKIRWLFWYQGESNSGDDRYDELFHQLYSAWHEDLSNLEHIVVVQIRPGCGGDNHARLRDDQRRLQDIYTDVITHTACALPGHDGCHFTQEGYRQLGDQLFALYKDVESGDTESAALAPTIVAAQDIENERLVVLRIRNADSLRLIQTASERLQSAFFFDGSETLRPDSAWITGSSVFLSYPEGTQPTTVSYIPSKNDPFTNVLFQGPWITDELGIGLLSFHNVPLTVTSTPVIDEPTTVGGPICVRRGEVIQYSTTSSTLQLISLDGQQYEITVNDSTITVPRVLPLGFYGIVDQRTRQPRLLMVTE